MNGRVGPTSRIIRYDNVNKLQFYDREMCSTEATCVVDAQKLDAYKIFTHECSGTPHHNYFQLFS